MFSGLPNQSPLLTMFKTKPQCLRLKVEPYHLVITIVHLLTISCYDSCAHRSPFFSVMVIGSFTLCYLPGFICLLLTVKLGPNRIPNPLRSSVIVLMAINSGLNPIIYMFRSNEFRVAFKKLFRSASIAPLPTDGRKKAPAGGSHLEVSTCNQHGLIRQPSFLTVSTEDVEALSCGISTSTEVVVEMTGDLS